MKKIKLHPLFLVLALFFILMGEFLLFVTYFIVVIFHEFTHSFVAKKIGYQMNKISLLPFGAGLTFEQNFYEERDEIFIALAGPIFNFLMVVIFVALWWICPETVSATENFVYANFITGVVNLLPCYPLDGGRVLIASLTKKLQRKKASKVCLIINYCVSIILLILFFLGFNITFLLMSLFVFLGIFDSKFNGKYEICNFVFSHNFENKSKIQINQFGVSSDMELYKIIKLLDKNKFNIVYVFFNKKIKILTQNQLEKILINNQIDKKINQVID